MKTTDPHPGTFLAFASRLREDVEWAASVPEALIGIGEFDVSGAAAVRAFHAHQDAAFEAALARGIEDRLRRAGPIDVRGNPALGALIQTHATQNAAILSAARVLEIQRPTIDKLVADPWRPRRDTVADIIVGGYLAAGADTSVAALDLLNRHAPRYEEVLIDYGHVRDAIANFVQRTATRPVPVPCEASARSLCRVLLQDFRTLAALWEDVNAAKGVNKIERYWTELRRSGRLLEMFERANGVDRTTRGEVDTVAGRLVSIWLDFLLAKRSEGEATLAKEIALADGSRNAALRAAS